MIAKPCKQEIRAATANQVLSLSQQKKHYMNSRIKMKHRRGAGRAGLELLNAYNVLQPKDLTG